MNDRKLLSIVAPMFNEEGNVRPLYERLVAVLDTLDLDWEVIFVDDGSTDHTAEMVRDVHSRDARVKALFFSRNFGHEVASTAGLDASRGDAAVLIDADLQDPPETIPALVEKWREGFDVVCAQRVRREGETFFKRTTAFLFYRLMGKLVGWNLPRDTGDFRLMDRRALDAVRRCRESNRFIRGLVAWTGFRQTTVGFERAPRLAGETKYDTQSLLSLAATCLTGFSLAPLRIALWLGLAIVPLAIIAFVILAIVTLCGGQDLGYGLLLASIWFLGGVQCLFVGILGEYVGRTYIESRNRPLYFVRDALGFEDGLDIPRSRDS